MGEGFGSLFQLIRNGLVETLVFGEARSGGTAKWEKRFKLVAPARMPVAEQAEEAK